MERPYLMPEPKHVPVRNSLSFERVESFEKLASARFEINDLVLRTKSDIYFTFDWLRIWWKHYGSERRLICFLVRENGALVAALPFFTQRMGVLPLGLTVARFIGADSTIPVFSPPIMPGYEIPVLGGVVKQLLQIDHCEIISFSPLSGRSPFVTAMRKVCADDPTMRISRDDIIGCHTEFSLPSDFQSYLLALPKRQRSNYRRDLNQLSRLYELDHKVVTGSAAVAIFDDFVKIHNLQWATVDRLGHFGDWPESQAFNHDLVEFFATKGHAQFHVLTGGNQVLSIQFGFGLGDRFFWRLPARVVGAGLEKLGLGRVGLVLMIEALIKDGAHDIEAGPGHYEYKTKHGGEESALRQLIVTRVSTVGLVRNTLFLWWGDILNLFYYRLWYLRVSRHVSFLRRPLWRAWIRTRL